MRFGIGQLVTHAMGWAGAFCYYEVAAFQFHNLYEHTCFSIFDLLWVRDFNVEISVEYDYATYKE